MLNLEPDKRLPSNLRLLVRLLKKQKFIVENNIKERMLLELATNMSYQEECKGKVMARYAEKGDTFHILLSGKCSVWLPLQPEQAEKVIKSCIESNAIFKL